MMNICAFGAAVSVVCILCQTQASCSTGESRSGEAEPRHSLQMNLPEVLSWETVTNVPLYNTTCPPWFLPDSNGTGCTCGSDRANIVMCDNISQQTYLLSCYCMTYDNGNAVIGQCSFGCFLRPEGNNIYVSLPPTIPELNYMMCGQAHKEGQLCGKCKDGFAAPIYSYDMACVQCSENTTNWVKYTAAAFVPLTVFLVIVVISRINASSAHLNGFVLISQLIAAPQQMRLFANRPTKLPVQQTAINALCSFYGIWNLDYFRQLYSPYCLYPRMTVLKALTFDYIIAFYPLALIVIMYLLVQLHDYNFRPAVWLWKPFHFCAARFRRQLAIRKSLVDAYATFFLLSYIKILSVSFDLLLPTRLIDIHGHTVDKRYLYYDGTIEFFGETHRPYAILAIAILVAFIFCPLLLLVVYQCRCFHRCTQYCGFTCNTLHTFMDAFLGCYKDGTNRTHDCRCFSIAYLILRILLLLAYTSTLSVFFYAVGAALWAAAALSVAIIRPYKVDFCNNWDTFMLTGFSVSYALVIPTALTNSETFLLLKPTETFIALLAMIPIIYIVGYTLWRIVGQTRLTAVWYKARAMLSSKEANLENSLPHRITHAHEYTPLLSTAEDDQDKNI